ncbi:RimK family alpha-L-glutamate ligase [Nonomuraea sp. NPDC050310]|uniref:ATP-grasp domain-containing protein n=1 Tax=unclassified Nonomuraea TaxID=2593643 RepID=UPI0033D081D6
MRLALVSRTRLSATASRIAQTARTRGWDVQIVGDPATITQVGATPATTPDVVYSRILGTEGDLVHLLYLQRQLERRGIPVVNPAAAVESAVSKARQAAIFTEHGLPHPQTCVITPFADPAELGALLGFPLVLKPDAGLGGGGVVKADEAAALGALLVEKALAGQWLGVAQRMVPEAWASLRLVVVGGRVVACMQRRAAAGEWRSNVAQGATAVPVEPTDAEVDLAVLAAATLGLDVAGVDVIRAAEGPLVLEVNCSPGLVATEQATGVPVCELILDMVEERAAVLLG